MMEVVSALSTNINGANGGTKKHIQEWSRLDKLTGMLEHARVEADHWASNTSNSKHHFGKVVDSRARNLADGSVQQKQQTKQLEVFQAHIPGGSVQVIRSHTSTTSSWHNSKVLQSPSSTWTSLNSTDNLLKRRIGDMEVEIDSLKFDHNPVNLDSEKTKVNIARHLANRRPPTRSKNLKLNNNDTAFTTLPITYDFDEESKDDDKTKTSSFGSLKNNVDTMTAESGQEKLDKKKSISDENLSFTSQLDDIKVKEEISSSPLLRSCRTRWSYQHPTSSRYKEKIDNSVGTIGENKSELENVLKKFLRNKPDYETYSKNLSTVEIQNPTPLLRKNSFVTEATLQETRRKLRHLSKNRVRNNFEDVDDGIFTESKCNSDKEDEKVDIQEELENAATKNPSPKCLEFRAINKSDDWFDRRKSYGFEPVRPQNISSSLNSTPKTNSSTDSGICRSSELELTSTSIIKKVTEAKEDKIHLSNREETKPIEFSGKSDVPELMRKFEKLDKSKVGPTVVTFTEVPKIKVLDSSGGHRDIIKKGRVSEAIKSFEKNGINCKTSVPASLTKSGSYFLEDLNEKENLLTPEKDFLAKRHSIACDDTNYMTSTFTIPEPSFPEKISLPGKPTVVNVNNFESSYTPSSLTDADAKKPKKVEFSKTEVHFAATEPGKIRIVETDEKPPPMNLYRKKKRSVSVSPRSDSQQTKFDIYKNFTHPENTPEKISNDADFQSQFKSTVSDNGLAVTISSAKPTDYRRASWSVAEGSNLSPSQLENRAGYSTKINFGREGVTVIADSKSPQHEKHARDSRISSMKEINKPKDTNANENGENIHERLIVSIGGSASGNRTTGKYVQKPTFTNSFRNSIKSSKAAIGFEKLSSKKNDSLKSTSLIIDTIKLSTNSKVAEKENEISYTKTKNLKPTAEQPSTYITEMNRLQRRYRVKENQSTKGEVKNGKNINGFYNTIPAVKNGYARTKLLNNNLPEVLSAFDNLCRTIDQVMEKNTNAKSQNTRNCIKMVENISVPGPVKLIDDERSSQSRFLYNTANCDDGNISDDSLKADKEVQSYMSTAIMDEYENELCGSWSRKRYFKHIKPIKIVHQDELSEKCHFKPLKNNEDEMKITTNMVDVKKPKIASVAMKLDIDKERDGSADNVKKSTVILNQSPKIETIVNDTTSKESNENVNIKQNSDQTINTNDYVNTADLKEAKLLNTLTKTSAEEMFRKENDPAKVIYHNIEFSEKMPQNGNEKKSYFSRRGSDRDIAKHRKTTDSKESAVHHIRRPTKYTNSKEKLADSGRDGWLNLPKERKVLLEKKSIENGKHETYRKPHIDHVKKDKRNRSGMNGCGDISSEEDSTKRNGKLYVPLSTIHEKSKVNKTSKLPVIKMASNSLTENQSTSAEFKNPVLKTEERSRRRAARMLQRASSREMLMNSNVASSSDDVTSENEIHYPRSSKPRTTRKLKSSPKTLKPVTNSDIPPKKTITSSAKMQINIFNIKDRTDSEKRSATTHSTSSRFSNSIDDKKLPKSRPHAGQREVHATAPEKSRQKQVSCSNRDNRNSSTSTVKTTRQIR